MSGKDKRPVFDLIVCIRCHDYRPFVLDTADSVLTYTDRKTTKLMCAVDGGNPQLTSALYNSLSRDSVFTTPHRHHWGAGLFGLLAKSVLYAATKWRFSHFMSIDYDTLFIKAGADDMLLNQITDPCVGLMGEYTERNQHWSAIFEKDRAKIEEVFGKIPKSYHPGEGIQGGGMLLTRALISRMLERRMFSPPFSLAHTVTSVADDHLLPLFCRMCDLEIAQAEGLCVKWQLDCNPLGLQEKGKYILHPTKIRPGRPVRSTEVHVRNYYRDLRGRKRLSAT